MTDDEPTPKLPRGRWFGGGKRTSSTTQLLRIGMVATLLVMLIVLGKPCAEGMARFVESFAPPPDAGPAAVGPPAPTMQYERLTEDQIKERFKNWDDGGARGDHTAPAQAPGPSREGHH